LICVKLQCFKTTFVVLFIYRPSSAPARNKIFSQFTSILETFTTLNCHILVTGDLNLKLHDPLHVDCLRFGEVLVTFGLVQLVAGPTHLHGGTLDVVVVRSDLVTPDVHVFMPEFSDHSAHAHSQASICACHSNVEVMVKV